MLTMTQTSAAQTLGIGSADYQLLTATHEAGHIIVADEMGLSLHGAVLHFDGEDRDVDGCAFIGPSNVTPDGTSRPMGLEAAVSRVTMYAAGPAAGAMWLERRGKSEQTSGHYAVLSGDLDHRRAEQLCTQHPGFSIDADGEFSLFTAMSGYEPAALILRRRWSSVERVAHYLATHRKVTPADLNHLLRKNRKAV